MGQGPSGPEGPQGPPGPQGREGKSNLTWSNLTNDQKAEIVASLAKLPEARGPQGLPGISDPIQVASKLLENANLKTEVAKSLAPLPEFNTSFASTVFGDTNHFNRLMTAMYDKIDPSKSATFIDKLSEHITSRAEYKNRLKGDAGNVGDFASMKESLITKTLWCADGEICTLPKDYWDTAGANTAGSVIGIQMNAGTQNLSFGNNTEKDTKGFLTRNPNHGLSHRDFFGKNDNGTWKIPVDGPFLHGKDGGQLGFVQKTGGMNKQDWALQWNTGGNVTISGELSANGYTNRLGVDTVLGLRNSNNNKWILHAPDRPGRVLHVASLVPGGDWDWNSQVNIQPYQIQIGNWKINTSDGHFRVYEGADQKFVLHAGNGRTWFKDTNYIDDRIDTKITDKVAATDTATRGWARDRFAARGHQHTNHAEGWKEATTWGGGGMAAW